eukprot:1156488-Pelagomonas_calceolata.AAC.2
MVRFVDEDIQGMSLKALLTFFSTYALIVGAVAYFGVGTSKFVVCMHVRFESILKIGEVDDFRTGCRSCGCAGTGLSVSLFG